ncbi:MAG: hypothetical protein U5K54_07000 [Cytophagales bacterium]|nr:hypothetical protein [Cytophagales bacterium]
MREQWDRQLRTNAQPSDEYDFELRPRDRLTNGIYGAYYGASIAAIGEFMKLLQ